MTMGQQKDRQGDLMVGWAEMPRSPGHVFYDRLQSVLIEGGFDGFAEAACRSFCCPIVISESPGQIRTSKNQTRPLVSSANFVNGLLRHRPRR